MPGFMKKIWKDNSGYKTVELAEMLDINRKTVSVKLKNLREKDIIEGGDRHEVYENAWLRQ